MVDVTVLFCIVRLYVFSRGVIVLYNDNIQKYLSGF